MSTIDPSAGRASAARPLDDPATLRALVGGLREGLYVADGDGRLLDANAAFAALVGASEPAQLVGRRIVDLMADAAGRERSLAAATSGATTEAEVSLLAPDGGSVPALERVTILRQADGTVRRLGVIQALGAAVPAMAAGGRDALTGCLDRAHLNELGETLAHDGGAHAGVVIVRFERGRAGVTSEGADILRQRVARFLMRHVRGDEPVVRLADDDFLVVLAGARQEHTERVARRVQLLALRDAPAPLSLGWAAREQGESLAAVVTRALDTRVPVPYAGGQRAGSDGRRTGEQPQIGGTEAVAFVPARAGAVA